MADRFGISLNGLHISLDSDGGDNSYVSHAHSDHWSHSSRRIISSDETLALIGGREKAEMPKGMTLFNAGHILGSTQLGAELDGGSFVYTGDIKLKDGLTTNGADVRECDLLMIEGTYGSPEFLFPPREETYSSMEKWVKENSESIIVFGGYSVGKAQELILFLNRHCGMTPVVSERIERVCSVYDQFGVRLDRIPAGTEEARELMRSPFAAVIPHHLVCPSLSTGLSEIYGRKTMTALATGWGVRHKYPVDAVFPLSDHADFNELLLYIERASPKEIICVHGNKKKFAKELIKRGYNARGWDSSFQPNTAENHVRGLFAKKSASFQATLLPAGPFQSDKVLL